MKNNLTKQKHKKIVYKSTPTKSSKQNTNNNVNNLYSNNLSNNNTTSSNSYTYTATINLNTLHKGQADTFSFKIPTSSLYEPMLISIYSIGEEDVDRFSAQLFVCNLYFDKMKLLKFLNQKEGNNAVFYSDESLNFILNNIYLEDQDISILDNKLKMSLISSLIPQNVY